MGQSGPLRGPCPRPGAHSSVERDAKRRADHERPPGSDRWWVCTSQPYKPTNDLAGREKTDHPGTRRVDKTNTSPRERSGPAQVWAGSAKKRRPKGGAIRIDYSASSAAGASSRALPLIESLNSRMPWPSERPAAGRRFGPSTTSAMTRTTTSSMGPILGIAGTSFPYKDESERPRAGQGG